VSSKLITRRFSNREGSGALEHSHMMSGMASGGGAGSGLVR
jgi:hypothetical protein